MSEIIAIILAGFRTEATEDFLRKELAPYISQLTQFTFVLPLVTLVSSTLLRANPTAQAEVTSFINTISQVLHDLSEPAPVTQPVLAAQIRPVTADLAPAPEPVADKAAQPAAAPAENGSSLEPAVKE